ncbi:MAG: molybdopterin-dependent oxidoreductase, partial [Candidatus Fermentibacteria bacterium]|nr:molybdopterin-dependent oxidoreductase [Candidatus Fermentibacteria bacterium]
MADMNISINGRKHIVPSGSTILEACLAAGIDVPTLCHHHKLDTAGNCRVCVVEVKGWNTLVPSCVTPVADEMVILTESESVVEAREVLVDLLLSANNCDCLVCDQAGDCELQDIAYDLGMDVRSRMFENSVEQLEPIDRSSPVLQYDSSKCIMCTRCIRACSDIQGKGVLAALHRGSLMKVGTGVSEWHNSACDGCGECIQICPTGALSEKESPGVRHWKAEVTRTTCAYCGVGCQLDLWVHNNKLVKVEGADIVPNFGSTCVKGRFGHTFVNRDDRLRTPLIRKNGSLVEATWEEAIALVAEKVSSVRDEFGGDAVAGLSSARVTNEENYLFQKMMRAAVGTNNVDHCARLCHASTVEGLAAAFGSGAMTNSIAELEYAKCILVTGSNTTETHPVIASVIRRAVQRHGAKLIVVDPRKIDLVKDAALWLRPKNGTDVAWLNGMMNVIINENLHDREYIEKRTTDFEAVSQVVKEFTPDRVEAITTIPAEKIKEAARIFAEAEVSSIVYAMGITQHITGTDNVL